MFDVFAPPLPAGASPAARAASDELRVAAVLAGGVDTRVLGALEALEAAPLPDFLLALAAATAFWADWTDVFGDEAAQSVAALSRLGACDATAGAQPAATGGLLLCITAAHSEAVDRAVRELELQCAALQLA